MLHINLNPIFKARNIDKPYSYLVKHGISYGIANTLIYTNCRKFRLDTIEKLCEILNCEVHDLLLWQPNAQQKTNSDHPLQPLRAKKSQTNEPAVSLLDLPYKKLKEININLNAPTPSPPAPEQ